jgi:hypothetical protein
MIRLNNIEQFQIHCLESYKDMKKITGKKALTDFLTYGVFDYLNAGFEVLHTQSLDYVINGIQDFIDRRRK